MRINSITAHGVMRFESLKGERDEGANAMTEGLVEAGEALEAVGNLFG